MARKVKAARTRAAVLHLPPSPSLAGVFDLRRAIPSTRALLVTVSLLAIAGGLYAGARFTAVFAIERIEVVGVPPSSAARVRRALAPLEGTSLVALRQDDVDTRLAKLSDVESATYDRGFPNTLRVVVRPERPAAVLRTGADSWLISVRARVIGKIPRGTQRSLPRVWVGQSDPIVAGETLDADAGGRAARAVAVLLASRLALPVRTVRSTPEELTFVLRSGVEIRFGDPSDLRLKLAIARRALPFVSGPGAYLDVSVPERPVSGATLDSKVEG
jgi:cell division protein FtsQ